MEQPELIQKLQRKLNRLTQQKDAMEIRHKGNEQHGFTYWGGFDLGYIKGKIAVLEDIIDELNSNTEAFINFVDKITEKHKPTK